MDLPIENGDFSIAMLVYQRVVTIYWLFDDYNDSAALGNIQVEKGIDAWTCCGGDLFVSSRDNGLIMYGHDWTMDVPRYRQQSVHFGVKTC